MDAEITSIITAALTTSPLLGVAFFLWKSGVLTALAKKITGAVQDGIPEDLIKRLMALESFKFTAESNHFHDLANVMEDIKEIKANLIEINSRMVDTRERLVRVETKILSHDHGKNC